MSPYGRIVAVVAIMLSLDLLSPREASVRIAERCRAARLDLDLTQRGLADRAAVSLGTLKRFERTGQIGLETLLKLAVALDRLDGFEGVFAPPEFRSLDEVIGADAPQRKRGRRS